jgi:putative membrane protein
MKTLLLVAIAATTLSAQALDTQLAEKATLQPPPLTVAHNAHEYTTLAASSDLFEIQSSQLLLQRSQNPQLRAFAARMVAEHPRLSTALMIAARQSGANSAAPALINQHANMLNMLAGSTPDMFDINYLRMQAVAHNNAVLLHSTYAVIGESPSLKAAAAAAKLVVQDHLNQVRNLARQLEP